ncbi:MAG: response regulator [Gemmatimonadota bacterium]
MEKSLPPAGSLRLLLAEDEPHIRRILVTLLEGSGFFVHSVSDGTDALAAVQSQDHFDLILLDIVMPGHTGLEILQSIRALPDREGIPVIILTAKGQDTDRDRAFALGADDFFTKPFSPKKLLNRVDELLARR